MKLKFFILSIGILSFATSCDKKMDKIFDDSPTDRLNISVDNAYTVLQANTTGWVMEYFPSSNLEFGGYTMFVKFNNNVDVTVEGDFTTKEPQSSTFTVVAGAGPILTFDTFNPIFHYFALPGYFNRNAAYQLPGFYNVGTALGSSNEGMKGENDFLVIKAKGDSVILEGRKSYNRIVMTPIKSSEVSTIVANHRAAVAKFHALGGYKFEVGTESIAASFVTAATKRALSASGTTYAYRYTPTGLSFYKEYELKGVKFKELKYVDATGTYTKGYFTNEAGTIKLVPTT